MPVTSDITTQLAEYLNETLCLGISVEVDTDLLAAGIIDSLMIMELVEHIQATYDVSIESGAIVTRNFRSVQTLSDLIIARLEANSESSELSAAKVG